MSYKLYIKGLDDKMDEGIPEKHIVLLTGTPGTMKSSISYNILFNNAKEKETKCLYLTLEQDKDNFLYHLNKLGMGDPIPGVLIGENRRKRNSCNGIVSVFPVIQRQIPVTRYPAAFGFVP